MNHTLGIDLGGTSVKLGLVSREGALVSRSEIPTNAGSGAEGITSSIAKACHELLDKAGLKAAGAGIGIPGGVNPADGAVSFMPNIPSLVGFPMGKRMSELLGCPVFLDNDANNAARGEFLFGAARGMKNFVLVTLGTGIGGGIFINGDIYDGSSNYSGEIGHMIVVPNGRRCGCGNYGCWEAYGSASSMITRAKSLIERNAGTSLRKYYPDNLSVKAIEDEAKAGDITAAEIWDQALRYVGIGIANLVNILNPEAVIIGGGIANSGKPLLKRVTDMASMNAMPMPWANTRILLAELGNTAGVIGSAALAFMKLQDRSDR